MRKVDKHAKHSKQRLYVRDQVGKKQWRGTDLFECECGAILALKERQVLNES